MMIGTVLPARSLLQTSRPSIFGSMLPVKPVRDHLQLPVDGAEFERADLDLRFLGGAGLGNAQQHGESGDQGAFQDCHHGYCR